MAALREEVSKLKAQFKLHSSSPHIRPSKDKDAAAVLVELLKPDGWISPGTRAVAPGNRGTS